MSTHADKIVSGTVEFWAYEKPDGTAIIEGDRILTYGEWNTLSNHLAEGLAQRGLSAGDVVVVRTQIRIEWAIINMALAKLGCALLATNWRLTPAEVAYVLENADATSVICDDPDPLPLTEAFTSLPIKLAVSIDTPAEGYVSFEALLDTSAPERISTGDAQLIIYTSGTTGLPKGVASGGRDLSDPKIVEYLMDMASKSFSSQDEIVLLTLPLHHGAGPATLSGALRMGNPIVFLRRFDPEAALALIQQHQVTTWTGVPTMYKRMAGLPDEVLDRYEVSSITKLSVGAAPVTQELKEWIDGYFGEGLLSEGYGATETGMITHLAPGEHRTKPGSSGRPYKHVDISIRDEDGQPVATDTAGEIWVRTPITIHQYLNQAPLGQDTLDTGGYFRIGDVGRLDDDGYLYITDRAKDMIISGGVNLYPAEIEAALATYDPVQDVAVIGIPNTEFGEEVKAFVELKPGRHAEPEDILNHAAKRLASYKRPRSVEILNELPRNTMGKLLKRELREPYWKDKERKV